jgi:hypothetical protein
MWTIGLWWLVGCGGGKACDTDAYSWADTPARWAAEAKGGAIDVETEWSWFDSVTGSWDERSGNIELERQMADDAFVSRFDFDGDVVLDGGGDFHFEGTTTIEDGGGELEYWEQGAWLGCHVTYRSEDELFLTERWATLGADEIEGEDLRTNLVDAYGVEATWTRTADEYEEDVEFVGDFGWDEGTQHLVEAWTEGTSVRELRFETRQDYFEELQDTAMDGSFDYSSSARIDGVEYTFEYSVDEDGEGTGKLKFKGDPACDVRVRRFYDTECRCPGESGFRPC